MAKWWRNQSRVNDRFNNRTMLSRLPVVPASTSKLLVSLFLNGGEDFKFPGNTVRDHNGKKL